MIAEKLGKTEEEVLKEEVSKEKLHVSRAERGWCRCTTAPAAAGPGWARHIAPSGLACMPAASSGVLFALAALPAAACDNTGSQQEPRQPFPRPHLHPCRLTAPSRTPACPVLQLRLSGAQLEEKRQAETDIKEVGVGRVGW